MKTPFHLSITEALRLTRAGDLSEATGMIQAALAGIAAAPPEPAGDTIDLRADRVTLSPTRRAASPAQRPAQAAAGQARAGGSFAEHRYSGPAGSLSYRLYVPAAAAPGMPLVVMLHGCTQSPEDFARGTGMNGLADALGFLVAYPGQTRAANPQGCWNWFKPSDQQRDRGEPALIAGVTRQVIAEQAADPSRVYVAGLSAGGAAAAIMGSAYPDLYAAIGIHSGLACGAARDLPGALTAMRDGGARAGPDMGRFVPVITFHGDRDATVHEANSRAIIAAASRAAGGQLRTDAETGRTAGGRAYTRVLSKDPTGRILIEQWTVHGAGHAWSGGDASGSYTDPTGPDASREMLRFFLTHPARADGGATDTAEIATA